jgi:hypothetical protein
MARPDNRCILNATHVRYARYLSRLDAVWEMTICRIWQLAVPHFGPRKTITPNAHAHPRFVFLDACNTGKEKFVFRIPRDRDLARAGLDALACRRTDKRAYRRHQTHVAV